MRLLVITNLYFPDRGGGASVFTDLCIGLRERGWEVTVFTTHPYYPEWKRKVDVDPWPLQPEQLNGVQVFRHGIYVPATPSRLVSRLFYEMSFALSLLRSLWRGGKHDAVMVFCPMMGAVLFAGLRKLFLGEPLWLNVQDIPADAAAASGISKAGWFNWLATWVQTTAFNRADVWSTISPVMVDRLVPNRRRKQPLHLCQNWLNGSLADHVAALPSKVGRDDRGRIRLLYAGNIGKKQGLLEFCQWLAKCDADFFFQIHGNGGEAASVADWVRTQADPRFNFGEFLDEAGFTRALYETDWFVITEKSGSGASFIPSKLIPGIATGTPILAVCDQSGPLGREMREAGLGLGFEWDSISGLPRRISELRPGSAEFMRLQQNCLDHSRNYQRNVAMERMDGLLKQMMGK